MEVVAQQTNEVFMVKTPDAEDCFVVDLDEGSVQHHDSYQVVLKWGYWFDVSASKEQQAVALALVEKEAAK